MKVELEKLFRKQQVSNKLQVLFLLKSNIVES